MDALKDFLRRRGVELVRRKGVTSVGVGRRIVDEKLTDELCIQFTVARKQSLEALEKLGIDPPAGSV